MSRRVPLALVPLLAVFAAASLALARPASSGTAPAQTAGVVAFVGVTVLPMDRDRALPDHVVIVERGRIRTVGSRTETPLPAGATVIRGDGMFLLPGLADMHTHSVDPADLASWLASGVTTILDMGYAPGDASPGFATPDFVRGERLAWNAEPRVAPRILAGLMIDGPQWRRGVQTPAAVDSAILLAKVSGYEFLKVHGGFDHRLLPEIFGAASRAKLPILAHLPRGVPIDSVLPHIALVAHAEEFLYTAFADGAQATRDVSAAQVATVVKRSGVFVAPSLVSYAAVTRLWGNPAEVDSALAHFDARWITPPMRKWWRNTHYARRTGSLAGELAFLRRFTLALHEAGVPLLVGTDAPGIPFLPAGPSVLGDIRELVGAGLTPFEALRAATAVPGAFVARYVPGGEPFGEVRVGHRADLLLVRGDPRADLGALAAPVGVMRGGTWHDAASLRAAVEREAATWR